MRTIRRIYFYAVALISLEVVLWGLISLARSIFCPRLVACGGLSAALAQGLALILVGVPFFGFHWLMAQRYARQDMEERASGIRAAFLYGVLLGTLIPVVQNFLALANRPALGLFRLQTTRAFVGGGQVWSDNIIAIVMNLLAAAYFFWVLRQDWNAIEPREAFANLQRISRWIWMFYGLGLLVSGLYQLLGFILNFNLTLMTQDYQRYWAVNGVVLTLVGAPIWVAAWLALRRSLEEQAERESLLRLGLLYLISLTGAVVSLAAGGTLMNALLGVAFGQTRTLQEFLQAARGPLCIGIPFLGIWLYYGRQLGSAILEAPDAPRRWGMRRLYSYLLSGIGLSVTFIGILMLLSSIIDLLLFSYSAGQLTSQITNSLALLVTGLPVWLLTWRPMQVEAFELDDAGDHARRSLVRKIYLYLALFTGVIGGMVTAVVLLNTVLKAAFSGDFSNIAQDLLNQAVFLLMFAGLGLYHGLMLARDGRNTASSLSAKHALFPVLIFDPGDGFGQALLMAVRKATPRLPATLQAVGAPVVESVQPLAVVLPSDVALDPPAPLREWLEKYTGTRLVVPRPSGRWTLVGQPRFLPVNQAAQTLRQLAEGQELRTSGTPGWLIAVYIVAALIGLPILMSLIAALVSAFM